VKRIDKLSVLVVSWNGRRHLEACLPAILEQRVPGVSVEVLVLDNGSTDGTSELLRRSFAGVTRVESTANVGFAAGNNRLAERATGDALVLVNNDTRAEPGWLAALVDAARSAPDDVAAVAGQIVDWPAERLDFGRGIVTFDGHALALDQGRPIDRARTPAAGEELLFGCGGNLLVRADSFRAAGGFDERFFAYFEDVDLGWRLWAAGERVVACPQAVVRHRLSATSARLEPFRRGAMFERNALFTMVKNLEPELRSALLPPVLLTFLARIEGTIGDAAAARRLLRGAEGEPPPDSRESLGDKLRRLGAVGLVRRGGAKLARSVADRLVPRPVPAQLEIGDPRALAQLSALAGFLDELDGVEAERASLAARRRRSDREIFDRFPLWIVPAYPGDERLFASPAFASWLPAGMRFERARLDEVIAPVDRAPIEARG